jgi:DNA polymerase-3 subunit delta
VAKTAKSPELDAFHRIVILRGPDSYLRAAHSKRLVEVLEEKHGEIEQFVYDGATAEPAEILDELRSYGLLQAHKLVIVDQADRLLAPPPDDGPAITGKGRRRTTRELFERYAAEPSDSATLLLRADTWRPGRLDKAVDKCGAILKCEPPNARTAAGWCVRRCEKEHDCTIGAEAASVLVSRIGPHLARLDTELAKLAAFVGSAGTIGIAEIRTLGGLSREEEAWVIQSALLRGPTTAVEKLRELMTVSRQPEQLLVWAMTDLVRKLHGASQLHHRGMPAAAIGAELKLWGEAKRSIVDAAGRHEPRVFSRLLHRSVETDRWMKSGAPQPARTLETLAVEIADTLGSD